MKVCLDGQSLLGQFSGIGRYTLNLYSYLAMRHDLEIFVGFNRIARHIGVDELPIQIGNIKNNRYPYKVIRRLFPPNLLYKLPYDLGMREKFDIFHGTNYTYMPTRHGKHVVSIHDLAFMKYPETTSKKIYQHHMKWVPYCAKYADHVITISEASKNDIMQLLDVSEAKITVTPLAADERFRPMLRHEFQYIFEKYQLPERYVLFVGTIEARKNLLTLMKAHHYVTQNYDLDYKLVVVGAQGWRTSALYEYIRDHQLQNTVVFTGYVEDKDLPAIYNGARMFAMPSWYEGFGMPLVEAMQCGVPVIGSGMSSIPEVIGADGLLCNPGQPQEWSNYIYSLLSSDSEYKKWSDYSLQRATLFHWSRTAEMTREVYKKILHD
ncbi:glycosyltransferase family 1 protein [Paenibacillus dendritiformis]|uniref:glycosyltransferase family 4 protein n=1 Tax=Paenibacillus dendritiformis TaxID=130049 RepID=UPI00248B6BE3|nr:glycosyltransferase family 1 protein [Paenibacillus dendritiformis]WGU93804.1 glycosyltransferase family 1 protein [Paenibacillus dendritiformis]